MRYSAVGTCRNLAGYLLQPIGITLQASHTLSFFQRFLTRDSQSVDAYMWGPNV